MADVQNGKDDDPANNCYRPLTRWLREPGTKPPKALSPSRIAELRQQWQEVENEVVVVGHADRGTFSFSPDCIPFEDYVALMDRRFLAEQAYKNAISNRNLAVKMKLESRARIPDRRELNRLISNRSKTVGHWNTLFDHDFMYSTKIEIFDADVDSDLADDLLDIARLKIMFAEDDRRADRLAGIVRVNSRRKTHVRHL